MKRHPVHSLPLAALVLAALAAGAAAASDDSSYGYLRTVEGPARIVQAGSGAVVEAEANYPVLPGDLLEVDPGGRVEVSLPDFNVVRLEGGSELLLDRLALSAGSDDAQTELRLLRGELQLLVKDLLPVDERPRVDTANTSVYLQSPGVYLVTTDGYGWTEVVARQGFAELATASGSGIVRSGELAVVEGERRPRIGLERAGGATELELWGAELDGEVDLLAGGGGVDDHLAYAAAPLSRHGSWVWVDGSRAWRPRVGAAWRPYEVGWWAESPLGLVWVGHEPWAWVTYHYGSWVPTPLYGWVWYPGRRFAPAWVYWYWGPSYVAWVPTGYYTGYYGHHGHRFRFGIHGWAGGSWHVFSDWTFCETGRYRDRDLRRHVRRGAHLARDTRRATLERGLVTTDSRRQRLAELRGTRGVGRDGLPDVTSFVARRRDLPREVEDRVFAGRRAVSRSGDASDLWEAPSRSRALPERRPAVSAEGTRRPVGVDGWRRQSGALRPAPHPGERTFSVPERRAAGRLEAARGERPELDPRWRQLPRAVPRFGENRPERPSPSGRAAAPEGQLPQADRAPVVRRVWERIRSLSRDRSEASRGAPQRRGGEARQAPPPSARRGSPPPSRGGEARQAPRPSARPSPPPDRGRSVERRSSGSRRPPSASRSGEGSSRRSDSRSSGRRAHRRPPQG